MSRQIKSVTVTANHWPRKRIVAQVTNWLAVEDAMPDLSKVPLVPVALEAASEARLDGPQNAWRDEREWVDDGIVRACQWATTIAIDVATSAATLACQPDKVSTLSSDKQLSFLQRFVLSFFEFLDERGGVLLKTSQQLKDNGTWHKFDFEASAEGLSVVDPETASLSFQVGSNVKSMWGH